MLNFMIPSIVPWYVRTFLCFLCLSVYLFICLSVCISVAQPVSLSVSQLLVQPLIYFCRAAAPKETVSCRKQGDFCSSVCSFVHSLVPPVPLRPEICPLRPGIREKINAPPEKWMLFRKKLARQKDTAERIMNDESISFSER